MRIAFLGLGRMGQGMAGRLIAGHDVVVWNRTSSRAEPLLRQGAAWAGTPARAAAGADAVVAMLADDEASRSVWLGPDGVLAGRTAPGALAIECSTLSAGHVTELSDAVTSPSRVCCAARTLATHCGSRTPWASVRRWARWRCPGWSCCWRPVEARRTRAP